MNVFSAAIEIPCPSGSGCNRCLEGSEFNRPSPSSMLHLNQVTRPTHPESGRCLFCRWTLVRNSFVAALGNIEK